MYTTISLSGRKELNDGWSFILLTSLCRPIKLQQRSCVLPTIAKHILKAECTSLLPPLQLFRKGTILHSGAELWGMRRCSRWGATGRANVSKHRVSLIHPLWVTGSAPALYRPCQMPLVFYWFMPTRKECYTLYTTHYGRRATETPEGVRIITTLFPIWDQ